MGVPGDKWWNQPHSIRYRIADWTGRRWPRLIERPFVRKRRASLSEENHIEEQTFPPSEVSVEIHACWCVELYTPANIENLNTRLRELGLDREEAGHAWDIVGWLRKARDGQLGSMRLQISSPVAGRLVGLRLPLPRFVHRVEADFEAISRSVTRLCLFFVTDVHYREDLNSLLRTPFKTSVKATRHGASIANPEQRRKEAITEFRIALRYEIWSWTRRNFPGLFGLSEDPAAMPTCELAVTDGFDPFPDLGPQGAPRSGVTALLNMGFGGVAFEEVGRRDNELASAMFATGPWHSGPLRRHSILAVPRARYFGTQGALDMASGEFRYASEIDRMFRRTFSNWSLTSAIDHYERILATAHDGASKLLTSKRALNTLKRLRSATAQAADAKTVSRELKEFKDSMFVYEGFDFVQQRIRPRHKPAGILEIMRTVLGQSAEGLNKSVTELDVFLHQQANPLSATANLRLQWAFIFFGLISIVGVMLTLPPVQKWLGW